MRYFLSLFLVALFVSCEKVVDIDLNDASPALVIEGNVTDQEGFQLVTVTRTKSFTDPNNPVSVTDAEVTITDGNGKVHELHPVAPGNYAAKTFVGLPGQTYHLKVRADGKEYTASSTMPQVVTIDSMRIGNSSFAGVKSKTIEVIFQDPPDIDNYYRFKLFVNRKASSNIFVYDDDFNDGKTVYRELIDFDIGIDSGDSLNIYMECIDKKVFKYWSGLAENQSRGGASTTPANPVSNISGGALGYFSAHTVERKRVIVQ